MEEYFLSLNKFKENINNVDLEKEYSTMKTENDDLKKTKIILENKINEMTIKINDYETKIKEKDEEIISFKKKSILTSMSKQIDDLKSYVSILEKQLKSSKQKQEPEIQVEPDKEVIINKNSESIKEEIESEKNNDKSDIENSKEELEEDIPEHETFEHNGKLYYKIKKKIYKINKDKTIGSLYGKIKNGVVTKED